MTTLSLTAVPPSATLPHQIAPARLVHVTTVPMSLVFVAGQVGYMRACGFEVSAVSSGGPELDEFGNRERVPVYAVDMPRSITPGGDLLALVRLYTLFRRLRPAIVHAHTPKGGLLGIVAARLARVPVCIYHIRGLPFMGAAGVRRWLLTYTEWLACTLATRVLCVSHSIRQVAISHRVCPAEKVSVLLSGSGNGVDALGRFDPERWRHTRTSMREAHDIPVSAMVLGFVGRIVRDKGVVELLESWRSLREAFPNLHLLFVGFFEPHDPLPPSVERALRADSRIHLTGRQAHTPPLYAAMDVLVLPTYREGFPNVLLEAAAMTLPVVATDIPGCTDAVVHGRTGTLVPPRNPDALATAIATYLSHPEIRIAHGLAGREHVLTRFRREGIWQGLRLEYLRLLEERHIAPKRKAGGLIADLEVPDTGETVEIGTSDADWVDRSQPQAPATATGGVPVSPRPIAAAPGVSPLSLRGNFSWTLAGNLVYAGSQWTMLTVIAKLGHPEMVGQFALALAVTAPVMMFANLNLAIVQATDTRRDFRFADYLSLRAMTSFTALALLAAIVGALGYRIQTTMVILAVAVAKVVESFSDVLFGLFQQRGRMDVVARSLMAKGPLSVTVMAAGVFFLHSVLWGAALLTIAWAVVLVAYDYRMAARVLRLSDAAPSESIQLRWAPEVWRRLARLCLPMGIVALVNALLPNIPRYVVGHELGEHALGIFAALAYVIVAGQGIMNALTSATGPRLATFYLDGDRRAFSSLVFRTAAFGAAVGTMLTIVAAVAGGQILTLLYTAEYAAYAGVFTWLMAASGIIYTSHFLWAGVTAARYFRAQAPLFAASIGISLLLCTLLVPRFGLMGAAAAVFSAAVFQCTGMSIVLGYAVQACGCSPHVSAQPSSDAVYLENRLASKHT